MKTISLIFLTLFLATSAFGSNITLPSTSSQEAFTGYHDTAVLAVTETYTDVDMDVEYVKTANITHTAGSATVTVNFTGTIMISAHLSMEADVAGPDRVGFRARIVRDIGAGFVELVGSEVWGYIRDNPTLVPNRSTITITPMVIDVTSGDDFKLQMRMDDGTNDIGDVDSVANSASLSIVEVL